MDIIPNRITSSPTDRFSWILFFGGLRFVFYYFVPISIVFKAFGEQLQYMLAKICKYVIIVFEFGIRLILMSWFGDHFNESLNSYQPLMFGLSDINVDYTCFQSLDLFYSRVWVNNNCYHLWFPEVQNMFETFTFLHNDTDLFL